MRMAEGKQGQCEEVLYSSKKKVCFSGMIHSELAYFLHLFDEDKVFKGWSNVLGFLVLYSFEKIVTAQIFNISHRSKNKQ